MSQLETGALAILALLGHGLLWVGVVNRLHGWAGPKALVDALTAVCFAVLLFVPLVVVGLLAMDPEWVRQRLGGEGATSWASASLYFYGCFVLGVVGLIAKVAWIEPRRHNRRVLIDWQTHLDRRLLSGPVRPVEGALAQVLGRVPGNEALLLSTDRKQLWLPRLPPELEGIRILHLSDLHMTGRLTRPFYEAVVETANALEPDVICLTGDLLENETCWPWLVDPLGKLQARYGVYFILGNHDAYVDAEETSRLLTEVGFHSLSGRWLAQRWNGADVLLGGNELPWLAEAAPYDLPTAQDADGSPPRSRGLRGEGPGAKPPQASPFRLVLCHTPDQFGWCCRVKADLALAGHTHGGQIQFPGFGSLASPSLFGTRYACGVFRRHQTVLHVTRGVAGKTPLRWRCPPEIALLELVSQRPLKPAPPAAGQSARR